MSESPPAPAPAAPLPDAVVRSSLRMSVRDGIAWSVMVGAGERYISPYIILGGSGPFALAGVSILPGLLSVLVQWFSANFTDIFRRRKLIFTASSALQALTWIPLSVSIFLPEPTGYLLMLAAFTLYLGLHSFGVPAWTSTMGDLVPPAERGRYFGVRNLLMGAATLVAYFLGGWWLAYCRQTPDALWFGVPGSQFGFLSLFVLAGLARVVSVWYLSRMTEPPYTPQSEDRFSLLDFIRRAPRAHFGRFVFYCALVHVGGGVVGPFFNWHLLNNLGLDTGRFAVLGTTEMLVYFATQAAWGRLADRIGNKRVLTLGGVGVVGIPALLALSDDYWYLLAVQVYDGLVWSAFNIASANYVFDIVTPNKRGRCSTYHALFMTAGASLGILIGATLVHAWPGPFTFAGVTVPHAFKLICLVSTVLRIIPNVLLLHTFEEWRLREKPYPWPPPSTGPGDRPAA